jgi:hypothetical protein
MITLEELKEKIIQQIDEVDIIDLLGLTTEDIVNAFEHKVEELEDKIIRELELNSEEDVDGNE